MTTEHVTSSDGTSIAFERHGSADLTVVLVEPPLRHRAFSAFEGLLPLLADHATVVTYDRRGRGESGDSTTYHPDREVEDLDAVIRAVGGPVGAYGYSAGALLALRAAAMTSGISRLVVLEPPLHDDGHPRPDPLTTEVEGLLGRGDRAAAVRRFHEAIGVPEEFVDEMASTAAWTPMVTAAHTLAYDCHVADSIDRDVLAQVSVPTLVLDSEGSTDDLSGWAATAAARLPDAAHRSLAGEWHTVADADLAPVIIEHLAGAANHSVGVGSGEADQAPHPSHAAWTGGAGRMERRLPRWSELKPLVGMRAPAVTAGARVAAAGSITDLRSIALRRAPRAVFDYVDGAAETETSLRRARRAFRDVEFQPAVLRDVSHVSLQREVLGTTTTMPVILAPTGFTRMMHSAGEAAVARAAADHDVVYTLSTMGTTTPEGVAAAAPYGRRWFQLYVWQDRDATEALVDRARAAGFETLMLTVDTAVAGARLRDVRNGLTIPPRLTPATLLDMATHPRWWLDLLTTEPLEFATLASFDGTVAELVDSMFDPTVTFDAISWLRDRWDGPLVVKGIQTATDAREVVDRGVDAVVLSNHGGRQLDRAPTPLLQVADVVAAVGDRAEVYCDGGVLNGADVVAAVATGARAVLVGRAYLYGLMAGGEAGVHRALELLRTDMTRTLQLMGVTSVDELTPDHVRLPGGP